LKGLEEEEFIVRLALLRDFEEQVELTVFF